MKGEGEEAPDPMFRDPREPILLTDDGAIAAPPALVRAGLEILPAAIATAGARASYSNGSTRQDQSFVCGEWSHASAMKSVSEFRRRSSSIADEMSAT